MNARKPVRLGVQVGADTATFGSIKHGDIDEVHELCLGRF
jgi:hypothetical protein